MTFIDVPCCIGAQFMIAGVSDTMNCAVIMSINRNRLDGIDISVFSIHCQLK